MAKQFKFDFTTATGEQIADAILNGVTTYSNLKAFRHRVGGTKKADAHYPNTRIAMNILSEEKLKARQRKALQTVIEPLSRRRASGEELTEILSPVLEGYKQYYIKKLDLPLTHEQVLLLLLANDARINLEKYTDKPVGELIF